MDTLSEIILFTTDDGQAELTVRLDEDTVWLTQRQMAELFEKSVPTVNEHVKNVFDEAELEAMSTIRKFRIVRMEGAREVEREVEHYNLDVIISVGYRVKSHRGTQFRRWATQRLRDYLVKGFLLNDARFKEQGIDRHFEELIQRIRDIRSSEKAFWKKVLEIYATSEDYDPTVESSKRFFATIQNKMHWAAHGHTAAEVVQTRADASKPAMGLTNFPGQRPLKSDARVAKNYLSSEELHALNLIVSLYLDFAELQALNRRPMTMSAWIGKLDDFLKLSERDILTHSGSVSHDDACRKADEEFAKYRAIEAGKPSVVEADFQRAVEQAKRLEKERKGGGRKR